MTESRRSMVNVTQFLRQYESASTKGSYRTGLKQFFETIYPNANTGLDVLAERYLSEDRKHRDDLLDFKDSLIGKAPTTLSSRLNAVMVFLDENGITLPKRFIKLARETN